jgi:hypothetical protein
LKTRVAAAVVALTLLLHVFSIVARIGRSPAVDEIEYLHVSWMMAHGQTLYQDFFEHHSPLLFAMFVPFAPDELADPLPYLMRARALAGVAGLVALALLAAVAWRFSPVAAAIAVSLMYSAEWVWLTGFAEVRAEPFALALMWSAIALLVLPRRESPVFPGLALGLMSLAALLNPKWPLVTLVFGVYALVRLARMRSRGLIGIAIAAGFAGGGMAVLLAFARFGDWWFYNFPLNVALAKWAASSADVHRFFLEYGRFSRLPWFARPLAALAIVAIVLWTAATRVAALAASSRESGNSVAAVQKLLVLFVLALAAALAENRFLHSYPHIWPQYFVLPGMFAALLAGLVPEAVKRDFVAIALMLLAAANAIFASMPWSQTSSPYWEIDRRIRNQMKAGETVWVQTAQHPITARDAHYYWFLPQPIIGAVRELDPARVKGPDRFPICTAASDADHSMRFVSEVQAAGMPEELRCLEEMFGKGKLRPIRGARMLEVVR